MGTGTIILFNLRGKPALCVCSLQSAGYPITCYGCCCHSNSLSVFGNRPTLLPWWISAVHHRPAFTKSHVLFTDKRCLSWIRVLIRKHGAIHMEVHKCYLCASLNMVMSLLSRLACNSTSDSLVHICTVVTVTGVFRSDLQHGVRGLQCMHPWCCCNTGSVCFTSARMINAQFWTLLCSV